MTVEAPDHYGGKPIPDDAIEIALAAEKKRKDGNEGEARGTPLNIKADINPADYIQIPDRNILIAKEETFKEENWINTHYKLAENGLFMPSPAIFMPYFVNVRNAAQGDLILYDGNNNPLSIDEAEDLWKYLSTGHRDGCWTWLDACFTHIDRWMIAYDNKVQLYSKGNKDFNHKFCDLESTLDGECYVDIDFDRQGFPKSQSAHQEYKQGENIYYRPPRDGTVARFCAVSSKASLYCDANPDKPHSLLRVFACAEKPGEKQ